MDAEQAQIYRSGGVVNSTSSLLDSRSIEQQTSAVSSGEPRTDGEASESSPRPLLQQLASDLHSRLIGIALMDELITVRAEFDAHHQNLKVDRCARNHGHRWVMAAEALGNADKPQSNSTLEADLDKVIEPWRDKSFNEIAPSGDPWGVAAWSMEMLILSHPNLTAISLSDGRMTATVRRTPR